MRDVLTCCVGESGTSTGSIAFTFASAPSEDGAAGKAVDLTVKNLMDEDARTVAIALPAYIGRVKMVLLEEESCSSDVMSDTAGTSNFAATRGRSDFAEEECAETTCVKGEDSERSFSKSGVTVSGRGLEYCAEVECNKCVKPFSLLRSRSAASIGYTGSASTFWLCPRHPARHQARQ